MSRGGLAFSHSHRLSAQGHNCPNPANRIFFRSPRSIARRSPNFWAWIVRYIFADGCCFELQPRTITLNNRAHIGEAMAGALPCESIPKFGKFACRSEDAVRFIARWFGCYAGNPQGGQLRLTSLIEGRDPIEIGNGDEYHDQGTGRSHVPIDLIELVSQQKTGNSQEACPCASAEKG